MALTAKKVYALLISRITVMESKLKYPVVYKGSVSSAELLPLSPSVGDMYNIESFSIYGGAGMNVVWNGTGWDPLGSIADVTDEQVQKAVNVYLEGHPAGSPTLNEDGILTF